MKSAPLALALALLGATSLAPAAFAQQSSGGGAAQPPAEASPSTSSPDASNRTGTQAQSEWRDQDGRIGGERWRDLRNDRFAGRDRDRDRRDFDDEDEEDMGWRSGGRGDDRPMRAHRDEDDEHMGSGSGGMSPEMMRLHMRLMRGQQAARLHLKRGDSEIDIRCPGSENINACVDAVGKLMDRLQAGAQNR